MTAPKRMSKGEEDFLVDCIARAVGWGCLWVVLLGLVICTVGGLSAVYLTFKAVGAA